MVAHTVVMGTLSHEQLTHSGVRFCMATPQSEVSRSPHWARSLSRSFASEPTKLAEGGGRQTREPEAAPRSPPAARRTPGAPACRSAKGAEGGAGQTGGRARLRGRGFAALSGGPTRRRGSTPSRPSSHFAGSGW